VKRTAEQALRDELEAASTALNVARSKEAAAVEREFLAGETVRARAKDAELAGRRYERAKAALAALVGSSADEAAGPPADGDTVAGEEVDRADEPVRA
jgi:hypothetical protein